uniref:Uncharacterized protein n=1 Tax=Glossina pallidipes TaxID=7398 RepID=A0A1B0GGP7_GLOPL
MFKFVAFNVVKCSFGDNHTLRLTYKKKQQLQVQPDYGAELKPDLHKAKYNNCYGNGRNNKDTYRSLQCTLIVDAVDLLAHVVAGNKAYAFKHLDEARLSRELHKCSYPSLVYYNVSSNK